MSDFGRARRDAPHVGDDDAVNEPNFFERAYPCLFPPLCVLVYCRNARPLAQRRCRCNARHSCATPEYCQRSRSKRCKEPRRKKIQRFLSQTLRFGYSGSTCIRPLVALWGQIKVASLWITINPCDLHDPIAQVFAGEHIDMDKFMHTLGPSKDTRAQNMASDPYAAARFFHFMVNTIMETLFGIVWSGGVSGPRITALAYVAVVKGCSQRRGNGAALETAGIPRASQGIHSCEHPRSHVRDLRTRVV